MGAGREVLQGSVDVVAAAHDRGLVTRSRDGGSPEQCQCGVGGARRRVSRGGTEGEQRGYGLQGAAKLVVVAKLVTALGNLQADRGLGRPEETFRKK